MIIKKCYPKKKKIPTYRPYFFSLRYAKHKIFFVRPYDSTIGVQTIFKACVAKIPETISVSLPPRWHGFYFQGCLLFHTSFLLLIVNELADVQYWRDIGFCQWYCREKFRNIFWWLFFICLKYTFYSHDNILGLRLPQSDFYTCICKLFFFLGVFLLSSN
jgi:hypothetical protein